MPFSKQIIFILVLCAGTAFGQSRQQLDALSVTLYGKGASVQDIRISLTAEDVAKLNEANGVKHPWADVHAYLVEKEGKSAGTILVDNVKGKARPITYAVAFDGKHGILALEILKYRESHGGEVQSETFRRQFEGKKHGDPISIGRDIRNISGATISSRSVTSGAHALATLYHFLQQRGTLEERERK